MKKWLLLMRAPFLVLTPMLAFMGTAIAWWFNDAFNLGYALLAFVGMLLAHISVNVLNEWFDYRSGVDFETIKTPFSGGSGALPSGLLKPNQALWLGIGSLLLIIPIGIFFLINAGLGLLPLLLVAAASIILYTPLILKMGWPEWAPGIGFGTLPILGFYFVQTGEYTMPAVIASIPIGILAHNLLLINELPDVEADTKFGRRNLPIVIGKSKASMVYSVLTVIVYLWVIGSVVAGWVTGTDVMPAWCLIALVTLPFAIKAIKGSRQSDDMSRLVPALASNVITFLATTLLLGVGYILAGAL
jgi:1,4-dihydroxy-2-naphthoate octaprenyltransferase